MTLRLDHQQIKRMYFYREMSCREIAKVLGISRQTVQDVLVKRLGLKLRPPSGGIKSGWRRKKERDLERSALNLPAERVLDGKVRGVDVGL